MAVCQKGYEKVFYQTFLAHNDLAHLQPQDVHETAFFLDAVVELFDVYTFHI